MHVLSNFTVSWNVRLYDDTNITVQVIAAASALHSVNTGVSHTVPGKDHQLVEIICIKSRSLTICCG